MNSWEKTCFVSPSHLISSKCYIVFSFESHIYPCCTLNEPNSHHNCVHLFINFRSKFLRILLNQFRNENTKQSNRMSCWTGLMNQYWIMDQLKTYPVMLYPWVCVWPRRLSFTIRMVYSFIYHFREMPK